MNKLIRQVGGPFCVIVLIVIGSVSALIQPGVARADDAVKPVAILSIASIDRLMDDFGYLMKAAGRADVSEYLQLMSSAFIQDFDRTRPAGVLITIEDDEPKGVGFLPVPHGDELLGMLKDKLGAEVDDLGNGIKKLEWGKGVYLKQQGEWLFFTDSPRHLSRLPEDPAAMLDGLDKEYGVALRFFVRNIPQGLKDVADFALQNKIDADLNASELADPELDAAFVESLRKSMKRWTTTLINDADQITVGWAVDSANRRTYIDLHAQAKDGSSLSRQFSSAMNSRSTFTGFAVDNAAATFQGSLRVSEQGRQQISSFLKYVREKVNKGIDADPNVPEALKEIVNDVLSVVDQTVRQGKTDVGATLLLAPKSFKFVGGVRVADGHALATAFQSLFELTKNEPDMPEVHFFARKHGELDLHTLSLPIDQDDKDVRLVLGEDLDITIATGPEQLYVALGKKSDELLETIVDRAQKNGEKEVLPARFRIALKPVIRYLASLDADNQKLHMLAEVIEQTQGGDGIQLTVEQIDQGIGCRLEIEEGVLELAGKASREENNR